MNTLSVCIISDNEESNLTRCLKSLEEIADEIILIDIGFTDYTSKIAERFNAKVIKFPWNNNYSSARNKALEVAKMDWILLINSNEALDTSQINNLKKILSKSSYLGYNLKIINIIDNKNFDGGYFLRIIRNKSGFYYKGRINEALYNNNYYLNKIKITDYYIYNFSLTDVNRNIIENSNRRETYLLISFCFKIENDIDKYKEYMKSYLIEPENNIIMGFNLDYINSNNILLESFGFNINNLLESFSANYKI